MHRLVLGFPIVLAASLSIFACSTKADSADPSPSAAGDDDDDKADDDDDEKKPAKKPAAKEDAGPEKPEPLPTEKVTVGGSAGQSCDQICESVAYTCAATCEFGNSSGKLAGQGRYAYEENNFTSYEYLPLKACSDKSPATLDKYGDKYSPDFAYGSPIQCCCQAPGHDRVKGDAKAPVSCDDICEAEGRKCDPKTAWGDQNGGSSLSFDCPGSTLLTIGDCASIPPKTKTSSGKKCTLESFSCGCL